MVPDSHLPTALPMGTCQLASPTCASLDHAAWRSRFEFSRPLWSSVHRRRGNARQCFLKSARRPLRCTGRILCSFPRIRLGSLKPRGQRSLADLKMGISASLHTRHLAKVPAELFSRLPPALDSFLFTEANPAAPPVAGLDVHACKGGPWNISNEAAIGSFASVLASLPRTGFNLLLPMTSYNNPVSGFRSVLSAESDLFSRRPALCFLRWLAAGGSDDSYL